MFFSACSGFIGGMCIEYFRQRSHGLHVVFVASAVMFLLTGLFYWGGSALRSGRRFCRRGLPDLFIVLWESCRCRSLVGQKARPAEGQVIMRAA